jgi:hypothetical protein
MEVIFPDRFWVKFCYYVDTGNYLNNWLLLSDLSPFSEHVDAIGDSFHRSNNIIANGKKKFVDQTKATFPSDLTQFIRNVIIT